MVLEWYGGDGGDRMVWYGMVWCWYGGDGMVVMVGMVLVCGMVVRVVMVWYGMVWW